jgi:hypothetical protein
MTTKRVTGSVAALRVSAAASVVPMLLVAGSPAAASPILSLSSPVRISGALPLPSGCSAADGNGAHAAVDPAHPNHISVVYTVGNSVAGAVATSSDGGSSWTRRVLPGLTSCTGGADGLFGDPMIATGAGGRTVTSAGWVTNDSAPGVDNLNGDDVRLLMNSADQSSRAFSAPVEPEPGAADQRGPLSFAPGSDSDVLVAFERTHYVNNPAVDYVTGGFLFGTGGSIGMSHSTDGGAKWQPLPDPVTGTPGSDVVTLGLVRSGGSVVLIYAVVDTAKIPQWLAGQGLPQQLFSTSSHDNGAHWSAGTPIGTYTFPHGVPQGWAIPDVAVSPDGKVYVAWPHVDPSDITSLRYNGIDIASSSDAGQQWTRTEATSGQLGFTDGDVYQPAIAAGEHSTLGLLFYVADASNNLTPRIATSTDAGRSWSSAALASTFSTSAIADGNIDGPLPVGSAQDLVAQPDGFGATTTLVSGANEDVMWFHVKTTG